MSKKRAIVVSITVVVILLPALAYVGIDVYLRQADPVGYKNYKICKDIPATQDLSKLVSTLGSPNREYVLKGQKWYAFATQSVAAGPITARINDVGAVVELRCEEDGPSTWIINDENSKQLNQAGLPGLRPISPLFKTLVISIDDK